MKPITRNFLILILGRIVKRGLPFFLLPMLTIYLTDSDFGEISTFTGLSSIVMTLISFGSEADFVYANNSKLKIYGFLTGQIILALIISIIFGLFTNKWQLILVVLLYSVSSQLSNHLRADYRMSDRVRILGYMDICIGVIGFILVVLLIPLRPNYLTRIITIIIPTFIISIFAINNLNFRSLSFSSYRDYFPYFITKSSKIGRTNFLRIIGPSMVGISTMGMYHIHLIVSNLLIVIFETIFDVTLKSILLSRIQRKYDFYKVVIVITVITLIMYVMARAIWPLFINQSMNENVLLLLFLLGGLKGVYMYFNAVLTVRGEKSFLGKVSFLGSVSYVVMLIVSSVFDLPINLPILIAYLILLTLIEQVVFYHKTFNDKVYN